MKLSTQKLIPGRVVKPNKVYVRLAGGNIDLWFPTDAFDNHDCDGTPYTGFKLTPQAANDLAETIQATTQAANKLSEAVALLERFNDYWQRNEPSNIQTEKLSDFAMLARAFLATLEAE